eukprot:gene16985-biopygen6768
MTRTLRACECESHCNVRESVRAYTSCTHGRTHGHWSETHGHTGSAAHLSGTSPASPGSPARAHRRASASLGEPRRASASLGEPKAHGKPSEQLGAPPPGCSCATIVLLRSFADRPLQYAVTQARPGPSTPPPLMGGKPAPGPPPPSAPGLKSIKRRASRDGRIGRDVREARDVRDVRGVRVGRVIPGIQHGRDVWDVRVGGIRN